MSFLNLSIEGQRVSLPDDFVIRMVYQLPFPFLDNIPSATTYWFNLQVNDINDRIFKHANFIYGVGKLKVYDCVFDVANLQQKGKLYLKTITNQQYKAFIVFNNLIEEIAPKKVKEVVSHYTDLGATTDAIIASAKTMSSQGYPSSKYAFPVIRNKNYFEDINQPYTDFGNYMNQYSTIGQSYVKNYMSGDVPQNVNPLVPMPYLLFILDEIFRPIGYSISGNVYNDNNFRKLICFNNRALQNIVSNDYFFGKHPNQIDKSSLENNQILFTNIEKDKDHTYNTTTGVYSPTNSGAFKLLFRAEVWSGVVGSQQFYLYVHDGTSNVKVYTYDVTLYEGWEYIETIIDLNYSSPVNLSFYFNFFYNNQIARIKNIELEIFPESEHGLDKFDRELKLENHLPDLSVSEVINSLVKKFSWAVFFDSDKKVFEIDSWKNILSSQSVLDLSEYLIAESETINFENTTYSFITQWDNDEMIEGNFKELNGSYVIVNNIYAGMPAATRVGQYAR